MKGQPREDIETFRAEKQKEIDELKAEGGKAKKKDKDDKEKPSTPPQDRPDIKVSEPNGNTRTPTGFSLRHRYRN